MVNKNLKLLKIQMFINYILFASLINLYGQNNQTD